MRATAISQNIHTDIEDVKIECVIYPSHESVQIKAGGNDFSFMFGRDKDEKQGSFIQEFKAMTILADVRNACDE
tara:strand:+ start:158 stop:379 length:222 start_codon:yes stop_codon:yes gene_type:complete